MIQSFFHSTNRYHEERTCYSTQFKFIQGTVCFSEYLNLIKNTSISFLVRRENSSFYEEVLDKKRLGEMYTFPSNLFLLKDHALQERLARNTTILVIYDESSNEISVVRDTFGTIPLYYCQSSSGFGFSTDIKYLSTHKEFPNNTQINTDIVAKYLTQASDGWGYTADTFYQNIKAVLPGHFVHYSAKELISEPIVSFQPQKWKHLTTLEELSEEFQYLFRESVKSNIIHHKNVSSHLSGGLDSSSVSSMIREVAPDLSFNTLYADTNTVLTDESHYASKVATSIRSNHFVVHPSTDELGILIKNTALYGFPEHRSLTPSLSTGLIYKAHELDSGMLMTGRDGDSIVGHGFNYLDQLFTKKRWSELKLALSEWASFSGGLGARVGWETLSINQKERLTFNYFFYKKLSCATSIRQGAEVMNIAKSKFGVLYSELLTKGFIGIKNRIVYFNRLPDSIVSKNFASQTKTQALVSLPFSLMGTLPNKYKFTFSDVFTNQIITINEENFHLAVDKNIELGNPFYSTKLYELSMAVPPRIKLNHGKSRGHLREAMKGILIDDVRNRPDKAIFNEYGLKASLRLYNASGDFLNDSNEVWQYVDKSLFKKCVQLFTAGGQLPYVYNRTSFFINRAIYLSIWLDQQK